MLNDAQLNYIVTEKEFLAVIFGFEKFKSYLIGSHVIVYTNHSALKHLFSKKDAKSRLVRWILFLQEYDCEIKDKKGSESLVANHLSRILYDRKSESSISECFPDEQLYAVHPDLWYADIVNYLVASRIPDGWTKNDRDRFLHIIKFFIWDDPYLFKYCSDQVFRRCIPDHEVRSFFLFVMTRHVEDVLVVGRQQSRFFNVVFTALLCLGMHLSTTRFPLVPAVR